MTCAPSGTNAKFRLDAANSAFRGHGNFLSSMANTAAVARTTLAISKQVINFIATSTNVLEIKQQSADPIFRKLASKQISHFSCFPR
jgi:hypothetical protein